jgi:hypothetical protein
LAKISIHLKFNIRDRLAVGRSAVNVTTFPIKGAARIHKQGHRAILVEKVSLVTLPARYSLTQESVISPLIFQPHMPTTLATVADH